MGIIIFILSLIPIALILFTVYSLDIIEKESLKLLISLFIGGMLSLILIKFFSNKLYQFDPELLYGENNWIQKFFEKFSLVGMVEELSKWIILYIVAWRNKEFNYIYDGIVYSVFVSMGFATIENFNYLLQYGNIVTLISRSLLTIPAHACFGIIMGIYFGDAKYYKDYRKGYNKYKAFLIPMLLHGCYDFLLSFDNKLIILFILYFVIMFIFSVYKFYKYMDVSNAKC